VIASGKGDEHGNDSDACGHRSDAGVSGVRAAASGEILR
jgi:hypothetical protein